MGLSEYTQINFFSRYSIFASDFLYPREADCEYITEPPNNFISDERKYLSTGTSHPGEQVKYLATVGYLEYFNETMLDYAGPQLEPELSYLTFDDKCFEDYAKKLIPRAIGYSADLLDYFFRGRLQVTTSVPIVSNNNIQYFQLYVKNITETQEKILDGYLTLIVRYTSVGDNGEEIVKVVRSWGTPSGEIQHNQEVPFIFSLEEAIPAENFKIDPNNPDNNPVECMLVFKGTLGNEVNMVPGSGHDNILI